MLSLAFYHGSGARRLHRLQDAAIRRMSGGVFTHVELIPGPAAFGAAVTCLSSSARDGGVREKRMALDPNKWVLVAMPGIDGAGAAEFIRDRIGAAYDFRGILLSQVFAIGGHAPGRWFCSEIVAAAIGLTQPHRLSPQLLFDVVTWHIRSAS